MPALVLQLTAYSACPDDSELMLPGLLHVRACLRVRVLVDPSPGLELSCSSLVTFQA